MFRSTLTKGIFSSVLGCGLTILHSENAGSDTKVFVYANLSTVKIIRFFKDSGEDVRVPGDAGVEPPAVSPVTAKRKKAGRRSSGIWRYFSDIPTGMPAKYNLACRLALIFAISGFWSSMLRKRYGIHL
jgi:hypothetical protein